MLKTLGLDDDLDSVEVVIELEKTFEVAISNDESKAIFKVGQLFDLLRDKVPAGDTNRKCASAMAFYRVRRALNDLQMDVGRSPSSDLSQLHRVYTRSLAKSIEKSSGLRMPRPALGLVGKIGAAIALIGAFGCLAMIVWALLEAFISGAAGHRLGTTSIALFFGGLLGGSLLIRVDAGRLPADCPTLGALAAKAGHLSFGRLVKQGADARDGSIWKVMVETLSDFANVPAEQITRDTYFLQSCPNNANTVA